MSISADVGAYLNLFDSATDPRTTQYFKKLEQARYPLGFGAGSGNINVYGTFDQTLAGATLEIDLNNVADYRNNPQVWARVKHILAFNDSTNDADTLYIGPGSVNGLTVPFNGVDLPIPASGIWMSGGRLATGFPVDTTHHTIKLNPGTATIPFRLYLLGCNL